MSKKYKNVMDKITVDEQMKKRILKNISNIKKTKFDEHLKSRTVKISKHNYYRNWGILVACCAIIICTLNNKYIFNLQEFNRNSAQNEERLFNESQDSNETAKVRGRIEADLGENKVGLEKAADTSKSSRLIENNILNDNQFKNDSDNNNFVNSNSDNEQSKNNSIISEENNINTNETEINQVERESNQYNGDMIEKVNDGRKSIRREFKTLDELKKSIDFTIKTPKVQSESNEIKSIIMDSNKNISIEYENKDYSLIFKIETEIDEENLNESQDKSEYESEKVININEKSVLLKGNNNIIKTANWIDGNSSFEIEAISEIKEEEIINIIKNVE